MTTDEVVVSLTDAEMRHAINWAMTENLVNVTAELPIRYISQSKDGWRITFDDRQP